MHTWEQRKECVEMVKLNRVVMGLCEAINRDQLC